MIKQTSITDTVNTEDGASRLRWYLADEPPKESKLITQVSGYCFDEEGRVLIVKNRDGYWAIPGGHRESGESLEETLRRELLEEGSVEISSPKVIGFQEVIFDSGQMIYLLRYSCTVSRILQFSAEFEIEERIFVEPQKIGDYISWWNNAPGGKAELSAAISSHKGSS